MAAISGISSSPGGLSGWLKKRPSLSRPSKVKAARGPAQRYRLSRDEDAIPPCLFGPIPTCPALAEGGMVGEEKTP